jgi:hypothetical protein
MLRDNGIMETPIPLARDMTSSENAWGALRWFILSPTRSAERQDMISLEVLIGCGGNAACTIV